MENWLKMRAQLSGEKTALYFGEKSYTFQDVYLMAEKCAERLTELGGGKGDFIALLGRNDVETYVAIHALELIGASTVFLNPRLSPLEMQFQLEDSGAKFLMYHSDFTTAVSRLVVPATSFEELEALSGAVSKKNRNRTDRYCLGHVYFWDDGEAERSLANIWQSLFQRDGIYA
ncbi:AMP-binding protein [Listeria floridensis]|nr:AMP-binding protein [Listeria floridensis]